MTKLFPKIRPYRHGYLKVGDGHELYYELCGNPKGKPVLYLHGGPGAGCDENSRRFFNPKKWNIILFDQRGAGRSRPFCSLRANTTWKIVSDIKRLLQFLGVKKAFIFGGSWGSILGLVYAIKHPETVSGMVLRGIFLGRKEDILYTYGGGAEEFFPDAWERFISHVPKKRRTGKGVVDYYVKMMGSKNKKVARKYAYEFAYYELSLYKLHMTDAKIRKMLREFRHVSLGMVESYYMKHNCFLSEGFVMKNIGRIRKTRIPVSMVQGRYDMLCPPMQAWLLHKALPMSRLFLTTTGHARSEPEIQARLVSEMKRMEK